MMNDSGSKSVLNEIQTGHFQSALDMLQEKNDHPHDVLSKALLQATYLMWIKRSTINTTHQRRTDLRLLEDIIRTLLQDYSVDPVAGTSEYNITSLHYCLQLSDYNLLKLFINNGVKPSSYIYAQQNTLLHLAISYSCKPLIVQYLIAECEGNCLNSLNQTPVNIAAMKIFENEEKHETDIENLKVLLNYSHFDVNNQDIEGKTALFAIYENAPRVTVPELRHKLPKICQKLVSLGADVNKKCDSGDGPIHTGIRQQWMNNAFKVELINLLLNHQGLDLSAIGTADITDISPCDYIFSKLQYGLENLESLFTILNAILCDETKAPILALYTDKSGLNIVHICCLTKRLREYYQAFLKSLLSKGYINLSTADAQNISALKALYFNHASHTLISDTPGVRVFDPTILLEIVESLLQCGINKSVIKELLEHGYAFPQGLWSRNYMLWSRAGFDSRTLTPTTKDKLIKVITLESYQVNYFRILENFFMEKMNKDGLKFLNPEDAEIGWQTFCQRNTLQLKCVAVLKHNLWPNAFYGVDRLKYQNMTLPQKIKEIILCKQMANDVESAFHCKASYKLS